MLKLSIEQVSKLGNMGLSIIDISELDIELYMHGTVSELLDYLSNNYENDVHLFERIINILFK